MKSTFKTFILLHIILVCYSMAGICSKAAAGQQFLSKEFILLYGLLLFIMVVYALFWQQILKRMNLVTAYANKAVTVIWGLVWGRLFFEEDITPFKILGAAVIIIGVYFVVSGEKK